MPRHSAPSTSQMARTRTWFGLSQAELALYLGVSPELVAAIEAGRRRLTGEMFQALLPLTQHLPPAEAGPPRETTASTALPPGTPAPDVTELDFRRRVCQQQATRVARELAAIEQRARAARRWAQALPTLLPTPEATAADPERAAWLTGWLQRHAQPLPVDVATRWYLLRARQAALAAEIAAL